MDTDIKTVPTSNRRYLDKHVDLIQLDCNKLYFFLFYFIYTPQLAEGSGRMWIQSDTQQ